MLWMKKIPWVGKNLLWIKKEKKEDEESEQLVYDEVDMRLQQRSIHNQLGSQVNPGFLKRSRTCSSKFCCCCNCLVNCVHFIRKLSYWKILLLFSSLVLFIFYGDYFYSAVDKPSLHKLNDYFHIPRGA